MMAYIIAFALTLILTKFYISFVKENRRKRKKLSFKIKKNFLFLFSFFPLWFISAFRYDVGTDYLGTYVKYFEHTKLGWKPYSEILFQKLNEFLVSMGLSYVWLFVITSFVFLFFLFKLIYRYSKRPVFSVVIVIFSSIFFNSLNNVRQYMALAIALYGFMDKKNLKKIIFILIASGIHTSCLIFFPLLILKRLKFTRNKLIVTSILCVVLVPAAVKLLEIIIANTKYSYFVSSNGTGFSLLFIIMNFVLLIASIAYYKTKDQRGNYLIIFQLISCFLCICSFIIQNEELWMRVIRIFTFSQFLLVPNMSTKIRRKVDRKAYAYACSFACFVYTFYTVILMGGQEILPYTFIFLR